MVHLVVELLARNGKLTFASSPISCAFARDFEGPPLFRGPKPQDTIPILSHVTPPIVPGINDNSSPSSPAQGQWKPQQRQRVGPSPAAEKKPRKHPSFCPKSANFPSQSTTQPTTALLHAILAIPVDDKPPRTNWPPRRSHRPQLTTPNPVPFSRAAAIGASLRQHVYHIRSQRECHHHCRRRTEPQLYPHPWAPASSSRIKLPPRTSN